MLIHEYLAQTSPYTLFLLCRKYELKPQQLRTPGEVEGLDWNWEMTHDVEGRYLDYTGGKR